MTRQELVHYVSDETCQCTTSLKTAAVKNSRTCARERSGTIDRAEVSGEDGGAHSQHSLDNCWAAVSVVDNDKSTT